MRLSYDSGRRVFVQARTAQTNDRGEFRLYWVAPGEYIVAGSPPSSPVTTLTAPTQGRIATRTFYPGTIDSTKASPVIVKSGAETGGFNFALLDRPLQC